MSTVACWLGDSAEDADWVRLLTPLLPGMTVRPLTDPGDPAAVRYAVAWAPPPGALAAFPNLRAVVSVGAGIDHLLRDPAFPRHLPILRTTGAQMVQRLQEYVALHVLAHHRRLADTDAQQARGEWRQFVTPPAWDRAVGVMGLGRIGAACAGALAGLGFAVRGWARSPRELPGVAVHAGAAGLASFLEGCEILVCLLPLTPATEGILNAGLFARLPRGAALVNAGRGRHLVDDDLLAALAAGQIGAATLDVFREEPLPPGHPFWRHPRIRVTPHLASYIDPATGAATVAANIRAFEETGTAPDLADAARGY